MLKSDSDKLPQMTDKQRQAFEEAVAEELAGKAENVEAVQPAVQRLKRERDAFAKIVASLRDARKAAGVSLAEMEIRTGIQKSALSRLENSKAPNPTLSTLYRYAEALGKKIDVVVE
jgi:DNA-binding XRE family transcriptional regulator